jgi:hypothetical protein
MTADYTISWLPSTDYSKGTVIAITLPASEFSGLPLIPTCSLSGGLISLESCSSTGQNIFKITTDENYSRGIPINAKIHGLTSTGPFVQSGLVSIEVTYSNVIIDESSSKEDNRRFTTTATPLDLSLTSTYNIETFAEQATFNVTVTPTQDFDETCNVHLRFSSVYPVGINEFVNCYSSLADDGKVPCSVKDRDIIVSHGKSVKVAEIPSFSLRIDRVMNPNETSNLELTLIGFIKCGYHIQDYGQLSKLYEFGRYPEKMYIDILTSSDYQVRNKAKIEMRAQSAPFSIDGTDTDQIFLDFSKEFDLQYVTNELACNSALTPDTTTDTCSYETNRISINGYKTNIDHKPQTYVQFTIDNVENPDFLGEVGYPSVAVYESKYQHIYSRSYSNLNHVISYSYSTVGQEVSVNYYTKFQLEIGTVSDMISVNIDTGTPTKISLRPKSLPRFVTMIPERLYIDVGVQ